MSYKNIVLKKIKEMPDELLYKVLIFIAGMDAQKIINLDLCNDNKQKKPD